LPITATFTLTSLIAALLLSYTTREAWLDMQALHRSGTNGLMRSVAITLLRGEITRLTTTLLLLLAGVGVLVGVRPAAYLIAVIPLIKAGSSIFDVRARQRQLSGFKRP
jgi:hypothetical protein